MKRVLLDWGSSVDVLVFDAFKRIGLSEKHLSRGKEPRFDGKHFFPTKSVVLPVTAVDKLIQVNSS